MSRYFLSTHSFVCETGRHAVFLDLKRDKYMAVSPEDLETLRETVEGWPVVTACAAAPGTEYPVNDTAEPVEDVTDPGDVIDMLVREGLLTTDAATGKNANPIYLDPPTTTFLVPRAWPMLTAQHLRNFVFAWMTTTLMLRTLPIGWIVARARRRKERATIEPRPFPVQAARQLTSIHFALQPAFYPAKDACLRNSLTLVEFLAKYGIYPGWVFGVKMQPFAAHSWVQEGSVVLTDPIDHVKTFTPIMMI